MNTSEHCNDDDVEDIWHETTQEIGIDEFLSTVDQSAKWLMTFRDLQDARKAEIYHGILMKIQETVQKNDFCSFKVLNRIKRRLDKEVKDKVPPKYTNSIILLACKYNRQKMLKHFLDKEVDETFTSDKGYEGHNEIFDFEKASYYAIRSNNVDLLETVIESGHSGSMMLYNSLAKSYESLRSKNVYIHDSMKIFVEDRLMRECFLCDIISARDASSSGLKNTADTTPPEISFCRILNFIIDAVNRLPSIASDQIIHDISRRHEGFIDDQRVSVALFIARNIRVLKGKLKSTVNQRPWTEMEFCLSRYSFLSTAERKKLHRHLINLIHEPKNVFGITDNGNDDEMLNKIKQYMNGDLTINWESIDDFEAFHNNYDLMKDEYSLNKMLLYIEGSLSDLQNPESQIGKLIIQRTLHVIGECVKNSPASPNLSTSAEETFISNWMSVGIEVTPSLRDTLSHAEELHVLLLRNSVENQKGFFTKIQEDLKRARDVVVHVSCAAKIERFKRWCEDIVCANDTHEFEHLCEELVDYLDECELSSVEAPEMHALKKAENLLASICDELNASEKKNTGHNIKTQIAAIKRIIASEREDISNRIMDFNSTLISTKQKITDHLYECRFKKRSDGTSDETEAKEKSKTFIKNLSHSFQKSSKDRLVAKLYEINLLLDGIEENVKEICGYRKIRDLINDVKMVLYLKSYWLMFTAIEEFKEKIKILETVTAVSDDNIIKELDDTFEAAISVLKSKETFHQVQSLLEKRKIIHQIKVKVSDGNQHQLTDPEREILHDELLKKRSEGKKFLNKTPDYYGEFLAAKRDIKKFAGSFLSEKKDVRSCFIDIFNQIKSQLGNYTPETALNKTIQEIEEKEKLTKEEFAYLTDKFSAITHDHEARLNLASFFDCNTELEQEAYGQFVIALNANAKAKSDLKKLYESMSTDCILKSLTDSYETLLNTLKNKGSTAEQISNSYVNFLVSLKLDSETKTLLSRTIIKNKIFTILEEQLSQKLKRLKGILGIVKTREEKCKLITIYKNNVRLRTVVEMLLLDLCNISRVADAISLKFMGANNEIPLKFLESGFLYLDRRRTFLTENSFRNYLAHGDALIDASPFEQWIAVISCAILFCEEGESLIALRDLVTDDKMAKYLFNPDGNILDQLHAEQRFNVKSLKAFRRSSYTKHYLKKIHKSASENIDLYTSCEQYLSQCYNPCPLLKASVTGNKQALETLLKRGEEIHIRDNKMRTLLHVAASEGHEEIVEILMNNGIDINAIDKKKMTSLHLAARNNHCHAVDAFLEYGADVNASDVYGRTPLHYAALLPDNAEVACILLQYGANCNATCKRNLTPLHMAAWSGNLDAIKLLVEVFDAKANIADNSNTPLHMATEGIHNNAEVFEYLLSNGCYSSDSEYSFITALLHLAVSAGNEYAVEAIFKRRTSSKVSKIDLKYLLECAAAKGNIRIVEALLNNGANVNDVVSEGQTALHIAAGYGHSLLAKFLIERNATVDLKCLNGAIPLHYAAVSGYIETVKVLVESGKTVVDTPATEGKTALHIAVSRNHLNIVKYLVEKKAHPNCLDDTGKSLLHYWAYHGNVDLKVADYLIDDLKIDINGRAENGCTPLMYAVREGAFSTVEYLVDKRNAQVDVRDTNGTTLLHYAVRRGNLQLVKYLMEKMGSSINEILNAEDDDDATVLQSAVSFGNTKIVKTLLETKNDKNFVDKYDALRRTPLYHAVFQGRASLVETLLEYGADVNATENPDCTPLEYAAMFGFETIVKILLKNRADPNRETTGGTTPLLFACIQNEREIIGILLESGANPNSTDKKRRTPLHVAARQGCMYTATALLERGARTDAIDEDGWTPLQHALYKGHADICQLLEMHAN